MFVLSVSMFYLQPFCFLTSWIFPALADKICPALPIICTQLNSLTKLSGFIDRWGEGGKRDRDRDRGKQRQMKTEGDLQGKRKLRFKGPEGSRTYAIPRGSSLGSLGTSSRFTAFKRSPSMAWTQQSHQMPGDMSLGG